PSESLEDLRTRVSLLLVYGRFVLTEHPELKDKGVETALSNQFKILSNGYLNQAQTSQLDRLLFPNDDERLHHPWAILSDQYSRTSTLQSEWDFLHAIEIINEISILILQHVSWNYSPSLEKLLPLFFQAIAPSSEARNWTHAAEKSVEWHIERTAPKIKQLMCGLEPSIEIQIAVPPSSDFYRFYLRHITRIDWRSLPIANPSNPE
ncbi:MAG: hypothetical protein AAF202_11625, partial [Pseudomonadota bacterium]